MSAWPERKRFGAQRGHGEREVVTALERPVGKAPDERRGVQELDDGDAQFAHGVLCGARQYSIAARFPESSRFMTWLRARFAGYLHPYQNKRFANGTPTPYCFCNDIIPWELRDGVTQGYHS